MRRREWGSQDHDLKRLAGEGKSAAEIGAELRRTSNAVRIRACILGISIRRGRRVRTLPLQRASTCPDIRPAVAAAVGAEPGILAMRHPNCSEAAWVGQITAYVANVSLSAEKKAVGRMLGCSPKMVRYAVTRIEDRRDEDPALDDFLDRVGDQLAIAA